jgi:GT2 family glycosyltransferase
MDNFSASIVLYKSNSIYLQRALDSFNNEFANITIIIIDNSPSNNLSSICAFDNCIYIHNPSNPGFGVAHNFAIEKALEIGTKYHFIVNPDVFFEGDIIKTMIEAMVKDNSIGMLMPKVLNLDGSIQNLPKLLPTPLSLILRKLKWPNSIYKKFINRYELRSVPEDKTYNCPILSGCFTLLNLQAIKEIGMYDDKFFMYFEDWDLSRRMHQHYKTLYFPKVSVYHAYDSGANKRFMLFKIYIKSAIKYFNKWGWFFDNARKRINLSTLAQFK